MAHYSATVMGGGGASARGARCYGGDVTAVYCSPMCEARCGLRM